jgi:tetratricopeptide (TPR) repeat protein
MACGAGSRSSERPSVPTFTADVAPILFEHCAPCHRPGQGAPFSLLTYDDARRRATRIGRAVATGHMPPWLPASGGPALVGERTLAQTAADTLTRWVEAGAPEGPRQALPPTPTFSTDWELGTPDLVVQPTRAYSLASGDADVFRNFVVSVPLDRARHVRAVEFKTNGAPVHHAVIHLDRTRSSKRRDGADGQPGFDGMGGGRDVQEPEGHFLGWAPGRGPITAPTGMPWTLERGTDLVLELHIVPGESPASVRPSIALYFSETPPVDVPVMFRMGSLAIDIPAGESNYVVDDRFTLPVDVTLLSVYPHAHYLGKEMRVQARLPDGSLQPLLHIPQWNFRWQQDYRFVTPIRLPKGSVVEMRFTYDNSSANEDNPHKPPRQVMCGQTTADEMGNLGLQVLVGNAADRRTLVEAHTAREVVANVAGAQMVVRNNPANAENQAFLGGSLVDAGRPAEALPHLDIAVRLDPRSVSAHNERGGALVALGRQAEALASFQRAVALAPDDGRMHFNVAVVLMRLGRGPEAAAAFERVLQLDPDHADAHGEYGALLFSVGRSREALAHLAKAADLAPDSARLQSDYGGALAAAGRYTEALARTRRALEIDPAYGPARENLTRLERVMRSR